MTQSLSLTWSPWQQRRQSHLKTVVGPRRELHGAVLLVERKVLDIDGARATEDDH